MFQLLSRSTLFIFFLATVACTSTKPSLSSELQNCLPQGGLITANSVVFPKEECVECKEVSKQLDRHLNAHASLEIDPGSYDSWQECLNQNDNIQTFFLAPGNYTKWGTLNLNGQSNITFSNKENRKFSKTQHAWHPVQLPPSQQVILENFILINCQNVLLNGISFAGQTYHQIVALTGGWQNKIEGGKGNIVNKCFIKDVFRGSGIRLKNTDNNVVLNSVLEQTNPALTGDNVAVLISADGDKVSRGNKILNNEIRNWNDGFMLGFSRPKKNKARKRSTHQTGECPATLFAYNSIYLTPAFHQDNGAKAFAENAIDLKNGTSSSRQEDKIRLFKNKIWGFRSSVKKWSSGSPGAGIALHVNASNIEVTDNIIFDVPLGISIRSNAVKHKGAKTENILIRNNLFSEIKS
ncbi:MAG: hypothetical protein AAF985_14475, partial [Bacteroidota bacterium]